MIRGFLFAGLLAGGLRAAAAGDAFIGRWALTISDGGAGWLDVKKEDGWYDGSLLWRWGSVSPAAYVSIADGTLTVTRVRGVEHKDTSGKVIRKQQLTDTLAAQIEDGMLKGTWLEARADGNGFNRCEFTGKRIPPLPLRPDLAKMKFGEPIVLFNGRDLSGWQVLEPDRKNAWSVENGALVNRPPAEAPGQPGVYTANLRTGREFEDFNLRLEVNVPKDSNSGVYLRGIYEVQILDSYGKPPDSHNMGAIYSRITPSAAVEKPPGEWQTLDITLIDRHVTVMLNGQTIIENAPLEGVTGGAMWADEFRPGPIYLQGDHGPVAYRHLVLRPVVK